MADVLLNLPPYEGLDLKLAVQGMFESNSTVLIDLP